MRCAESQLVSSEEDDDDDNVKDDNVEDDNVESKENTQPCAGGFEDSEDDEEEDDEEGDGEDDEEDNDVNKVEDDDVDGEEEDHQEDVQLSASANADDVENGWSELSSDSEYDSESDNPSVAALPMERKGPKPPSEEMGEEAWKLLTNDERQAAVKVYRVARKKFTDSERRKARKMFEAATEVDWSMKPRKMNFITTLIEEIKRDTAAAAAAATEARDSGQPVPEAVQSRLARREEDAFLTVGTIVPTKQELMLRIAEAANYVRKIPRTCPLPGDVNGEKGHVNLNSVCARSYVVGDPFIVKANAVASGWKVQKIILGPEVPPDNNYTTNKRVRRCAFLAKQLAPLVLDAMKGDPSLGDKKMDVLLRPYVRSTSLSTGFKTSVRTTARQYLYGDPNVNVQFLPALAQKLISLGHHVEIDTVTWEEMKKMALDVARSRHNFAQNKKPNEDRVPWNVHTWRAILQTKNGVPCGKTNGERLEERLGTNKQVKFVVGVLFSSSAADQLVPNLSEVFFADGAHLSWGSSTLYSMYGLTGNKTAINVAHGIQFGNENKKGWLRFFRFVKERHPSIASALKTVVIDQQKGLIPGLKKLAPAFGFHCSKHRSDNVQINCGRLAATLFNDAVQCTTAAALERVKTKMRQQLSATAMEYINKLQDSEQYPFARVQMGARMYGRSASSTVESMNHANKTARERTAVDIFNAIYELASLEQARYNRLQVATHERIHDLAEHAREAVIDLGLGAQLWDTRKTGVNTVMVTKGSAEFNVTLSGNALPDIGESTFFATDACSCGKPSVHHFPCVHMAAAAREFGNIGIEDLVPQWCRTADLKHKVPNPNDHAYVLPGKQAIFQGQKDEMLRDAIDPPRKSGRPRTKRIRNAREGPQRSHRLCRLCRLRFHRGPCGQQQGQA